MAVLVVTAIALASACYSPVGLDCTLACATPSDCIAGQVCGADHFCAAPESAGRCAKVDAAMIDSAPIVDARSQGSVDARVDAPAPTYVALQLQIMGPGTVTLSGGGSCASPNPACFIEAEVGAPATLDTTPGPGQTFDQWTTVPCQAQNPAATCTFTPISPLVIGVKFKKAMM